MTSHPHRSGLIGAFALSLALLPGCTTVPIDTAAAATDTQEVSPAGETVSAQDEGWWDLRFYIAWPEEQTPAWHIDLLLAHRVVAPTLSAYERDIVAWRFHRRAARDETGHRFSFALYAQRDIAAQINAEIQASPLLAELQATGAILYVDFSPGGRYVEDTSDPTWSPVMRVVWPIYINGVSQMWLTMIELYAGQWSRDHLEASLEELESFYKGVEADITHDWREEGQHALLHHLNALFAYEPVILRETREANF